MGYWGVKLGWPHARLATHTPSLSRGLPNETLLELGPQLCYLNRSPRGVSLWMPLKSHCTVRGFYFGATSGHA